MDTIGSNIADVQKQCDGLEVWENSWVLLCYRMVYWDIWVHAYNVMDNSHTEIIGLDRDREKCQFDVNTTEQKPERNVLLTLHPMKVLNCIRFMRIYKLKDRP